MAALTSQIFGGGAALTYASADVAGDSFANNGKVALIVFNGGVASTTVTLDSPNACSFGVSNAAHDSAVAVAAGATKVFGPLDQARFNDTGGLVQVTYSVITDVDVAVIRL